MPSYDIQRSENPVIYILITFYESFTVKADMGSYISKTMKMLDGESAPVPVILDMTRYSMSFDEFLDGVKIAHDNAANPALHSNTKDFVVVSKNPVWKFSIDGFHKFGIVKNIQLVATLDEVLETLSKQQD